MIVDSGLFLARTERGFLIRIVGRGTFRESPTFRETVVQCLQRHPEAQVVVDLAECQYLDSTFLGALIWLHKYAGERSPDRLQFHADSSKARQLLSMCVLDRVLNITDRCPQPMGESVQIELLSLDREDLGRHIEQSHRKLAELGGQHESTFAGIANRLRKELDE